MDQMRHAAKSNIGNVIRSTPFQGFIGYPFDPSYIYGCKDPSPGKVKTTDETVELDAVPPAIGMLSLWNNLAYRIPSNPPIKDVA
jgi:hypothetical protein